MSAPALKAYVFETPAQWAACLSAGLRAGAGGGLSGFAPLGRTVVSATPARLVARLANGDLIWVDARGRLHTRGCDGSEACDLAAPAGMADAQRLVAVRGAVWVLGADGDLRRLSATTFQAIERITPADLGAERILDLAGDGRDGVEVLAADARCARLMAWDRRAGRFRAEPEALGDARRLALLRAPRLRVVQQPGSLRFLPEGGEPYDLALAALAPGLRPMAFASDGRDRLFLATVTPTAAGWRRRVFILDRRGEAAAVLDLGLAADPAWSPGICGSRDTVWIADENGLAQFAPDANATGAATLITPLLVSPEQAERGWLRAEIEAELPPGARLTVSQVSTSDATFRGELEAILGDPATPPGLRRQQLEQRLDGLWTTAATVEVQGDEPHRLVAPLYAAEGAALVLRIQLTHPGGAPTRLKSLRVLYPELSLMRRLPAIFSGPIGDGDGFLRALVGVLEATTQDIDARIERLGSMVDPRTAPESWLDFLAGWFGAPWHQDLPGPAKRALLIAMPELLRTRGTRAGLDLLFATLLPGRLRGLTDTAVDYRPTVLAGRGAGGVRLPAVLLGRPKGLPGLGEARARLGQIRLKCPTDVEDPLARLRGRVRLALSLSAEERRTWEPILNAILPDFIPAGLALDLRWRAPLGEGLGRRLDGDLRLAGRPRAVLGGGIPLGRAVLGGEGPNLADGALAAGLRLT
ncbi:MAG: hypothetical protein JWQ29_990 [Phenylobacterium sp.]|nr:hypothetical protein [Phenylobacterium sp.]